MKNRNIPAKHSRNKSGAGYHASDRDYNRQKLKRETNMYANDFIKAEIGDQSGKTFEHEGSLWEDIKAIEKKWKCKIFEYCDVEELKERMEDYAYFVDNMLIGKLNDKHFQDALEYAHSKGDCYTDWENYMDYCHDYLADLFDESGKLKEEL